MGHNLGATRRLRFVAGFGGLEQTGPTVLDDP